MVVLGLGAVSTATVQQMVVTAAQQYGVPPALALGIASHESGFNPNATNVNSNGTTDWGVMQLNDVTVKTLGVSNPLDPQQNIDAGVGLLAKYLQQYGGDEQKALWAYASGPGAVASGKPMNSTASGFVDYVTSYNPDPILSTLGIDQTSLPVSDTPDTIDPSTGGIIDWGTLGLIAAGTLFLVLAAGRQR
jgi:soluble lytic murein transglycosylase-like protein